MFAVFQNNLIKNFILDPITKSNQNVISNLVGR
jgi:hypothetical protein